jgi:hypothetical protein
MSIMYEISGHEMIANNGAIIFVRFEKGKYRDLFLKRRYKLLKSSKNEKDIQ